ncbi:MAG: hypothetical protein L0Z62_09965 [Gemmataceae bacterium]|nr:hypothetical protein [Gemmataceae bacterium]
MTEVTYGQLDRVLRSLGFSCRTLTDEPKALVYEHKATGAILTWPPFPGEQQVLPHHLAAARGTLDLFGIATPQEFTGRLHKAS